MVYNLKDALDISKFLAKARFLIGQGSCVELTEKRIRTLNQNKYLHIILGIVASEYGETLDDVKEYYFKRLVNPRIFVKDKILKATGEMVRCTISTRDVTIEEMSIAIDRFKQWAANEGIYIPEPDDPHMPEIEIQIRKLDNYL